MSTRHPKQSVWRALSMIANARHCSCWRIYKDPEVRVAHACPVFVKMLARMHADLGRTT